MKISFKGSAITPAQHLRIIIGIALFIIVLVFLGLILPRFGNSEVNDALTVSATSSSREGIDVGETGGGPLTRITIPETKSGATSENVGVASQGTTVTSSVVLAGVPVVSVTSSSLVGGVGQASEGLPIRLTIPKIKIDATIEYVGVTPQGTMAVPEGPANVAWFDLGTRPGEIGSAVIAGHYGWKDGIPAAFDGLSKLNKGDRVYVVDGSGATITFMVRELRLFGENDDASEVFGSSDGKAHLNLITCEGIWDKAKKSYSNRLVAFTDKEIK